jgi:hypothetical protein
MGFIKNMNKIEYEILSGFTVDIEYDINEHAGKKIPTIRNVYHKNIDITEIIDRDVMYKVRSVLFDRINIITSYQ